METKYYLYLVVQMIIFYNFNQHILFIMLV